MSENNYKTLLAAGCILFVASFAVNCPVMAQTEDNARTVPDTLFADSIANTKAMKELIESFKKEVNVNSVRKAMGLSREGAPALAGRRYGRKKGPNEKWIVSSVIPWDGKSAISMDSVYSHTPEQEEKFIIATLKTMNLSHLPAGTKEEIKNDFLEGLQGGMKPYLRHLDSMRLHLDSTSQNLDSLYQYRDSLFQHWDNVYQSRENLYKQLKNVDFDSL